MPSAAIKKAFAQLELAPFDQSHWVPMLQALAEASGARLGQMLALGGPVQFPPSIYSEPIDDREWLAEGGADPTRNPYMASAVAMKVDSDFIGEEVVLPDERKRHPLIGHIHDKYDIPHLCFSKLLETPHGSWHFAALRSSRQGQIDAGSRAIFRRISRAGAVAVSRTLALKSEGARVLAGAFSSISIAAFVCDAFGRVVAMSEAAETIVRSGEMLRLRRGRLLGLTPAATLALDEAIFSAVRHNLGMLPAAHAFIPLVNLSGNLMATVQAVALPRDRCDIGVNAAALLIVEKRLDRSLGELASKFGLTKSEAAIARMLFDGVRVAEIAAQRNVSRETVRTQAKSIYLKFGVGSQVALIAKYANVRR